MKVLLIGEFSGAHYHLKVALEQLGHQVVLYSNRDAYKQIPTDRTFYMPKPGENHYLASLKVIASQMVALREAQKDYDVIQLISFAPFHHRVNKLFVRYLLNSGKPIVLFNGACSYPYNRFVATLDYSPCALCKKYDLPETNKTSVCPHEVDEMVRFEEYVYERVQAIVSSHYEYYWGMQRTRFKDKNHLILLPFPVDESEVVFRKPGDKLRVYLAITRIGFKGVPYMMQAIEEIQRSPYGKFFEFVIRKRLPYAQHKALLQEMDVLLDQTSSYFYGINAMLGLSLGKVVLSGAERLALEGVGIDPADCPIVNIRPDAQDIKQKLLALLDRRHEWERLQRAGVAFLKKYHDPLKIGKQYEQLYASLLQPVHAG